MGDDMTITCTFCKQTIKQTHCKKTKLWKHGLHCCLFLYKRIESHHL